MSNTVENAAIVTGKTAMYGGAASAFVGGLTLSDVGIIVGIVVGVLGYFSSQYWARKRDRRQQAETLQKQAERDLRMSLMRASGRPVYHEDTDMGKLEATNE